MPEDWGSWSHALIIGAIIKACRYKSYLELGLQSGSTYNHVRPSVEVAAAVDIEDNGAAPAGEFYHMTTDEFFAQNARAFDAILIDADHRFDQVRVDFENAVKILNPGGTIFLHDTDPYSPEFLGLSRCGDSYKINRYLRESGLYQFITLPVDICGLTIVRLKRDNRFENFIDENKETL